MQEEQAPDVEEIKARLKAEEAESIPVEEVGNMKEEERQQAGEAGESMAEALRNLGQQFAHAVQSAWESDERKKVEKELREGMQQFAAEVDKVFNEAKTSPAGQRAQQEAAELKESVEKGDLGPKIQANIVQGLNWLSDELGKLADQFHPPEKEPADDQE